MFIDNEFLIFSGEFVQKYSTKKLVSLSISIQIIKELFGEGIVSKG